MLGPFATASCLTPIYQVSLAVLSHAACASMSTTSTTTTTRDRGDLYGPMEWAQILTDFRYRFTVRIRRKFAIIPSLTMPSYFKCVGIVLHCIVLHSCRTYISSISSWVVRRPHHSQSEWQARHHHHQWRPVPCRRPAPASRPYLRGSHLVPAAVQRCSPPA